MGEILDIFDARLLGVSLRLAVPIMLAALGGLWTQQAGVLNIALEGMMLTAAFAGAAVTNKTQNVWLGLLGGLAASLLLAALFGVFSIRFRADLVVVGIAINLFATGATLVLMQRIFDTRGNFPTEGRLPDVNLSFLRDVPLLGPLFARQNILVWLGLLLVALAHVALYRTPFGLRVRAVGENPEAAETAGVRVRRVQFQTVLISGLLAGLGGVNLSLAYSSQFTSNMTSGRGFIALAAQTFGNATPVGTALASLFFGFADAVNVRLQTRGLPSEFVGMIPYLATVVALVLVARRRSLRSRARSTPDAEEPAAAPA